MTFRDFWRRDSVLELGTGQSSTIILAEIICGAIGQAILAGEDELTERSFAACFARRSGCPEGLNPFLVENFLAIDVRKLLQPAPGPGDKRR